MTQSETFSFMLSSGQVHAPFMMSWDILHFASLMWLLYSEFLKKQTFPTDKGQGLQGLSSVQVSVTLFASSFSLVLKSLLRWKIKVIKNWRVFTIKLFNAFRIINAFCSGLVTLTEQQLLQDLLIWLHTAKTAMQVKNKSLRTFKE